MPFPPGFTGERSTQDNDLTRSVDVVHIEPSIREGTVLLPSLYGKEASQPIYRYPPFNVDAPFITGVPILPATLTCEVGKWDGSPSPDFDYQWMADGVDIPGYNSYRHDFGTEFDGQTITCEVRGYSVSGEGYALSTGVYVTIIEPQEALDLYWGAISGIQAQSYQSMLNERTIITSGMSALNRQDVNRSVGYLMTGRAAEKRSDVNTMHFFALNGQGTPTRNRTQGNDVAVIWYRGADPLVEGVNQAIEVKNYNAELGIEGWTQFSDTYPITIWVGSNSTASPRYDGNYAFGGGNDRDAAQANVPYNFQYQDLEMFDMWFSDIDAAVCTFGLNWFQFCNDSGGDQANMKVEFLNGSDQIIGSDPGPGMWATPVGHWFYRDHEIPIPPLTRKIRIYCEFALQSGENLDAHIDRIRAFIRKGDAVTSRDYGPNFERWRIRFTYANTWSGCALQELEFQDDVINGTDLATGGTIIFGSEGNGGLAQYAFDDIRNNGGYWAGELDGVARDTAWLGYQWPTAIKPRNIDITARLGSNSLQMGRVFFLEGSNDGVNWIKVQDYQEPDVGTFTGGQQKQFEILTGNFDFLSNSMANSAAAYNWYSNFSGDDMPVKGNIWKAKARLNIDEVRFRRRSSEDFQYRVYIFQVTRAHADGMAFRMWYSSADLNTGVGGDWITHVLPQQIWVEVGTEFAIVISDFDLANNPNQSPGSNNSRPDIEGRVGYFYNHSSNDANSAGWDPFNNPYVQHTGPWEDFNTTIVEGTEANNVSYQETTVYGVDFKGSVF